MITDRFGLSLEIGDCVAYVIIDSTYGSTSIKLGHIGKFINPDRQLGDLVALVIEETQTTTLPHLCIKFSDEELVLRKLASKL